MYGPGSPYPLYGVITQALTSLETFLTRCDLQPGVAPLGEAQPPSRDQLKVLHFLNAFNAASIVVDYLARTLDFVSKEGKVDASFAREINLRDYVEAAATDLTSLLNTYADATVGSPDTERLKRSQAAAQTRNALLQTKHRAEFERLCAAVRRYLGVDGDGGVSEEHLKHGPQSKKVSSAASAGLFGRERHIRVEATDTSYNNLPQNEAQLMAEIDRLCAPKIRDQLPTQLPRISRPVGQDTAALARMMAACTDESNVAILCGPDFLGMMQLACAYARRTRATSDGDPQYAFARMMRYDSPERIESEWHTLAAELRQGQELSGPELVERVLDGIGNQGGLLILDGVGSPANIEDLVQKVRNTHLRLLITTHHPELVPSAPTLTIGQDAESAATALCSRKEIDEAKAMRLWEASGRDLTLLSATLENVGPHLLSIDECLAVLEADAEGRPEDSALGRVIRLLLEGAARYSAEQTADSTDDHEQEASTDDSDEEKTSESDADNSPWTADQLVGAIGLMGPDGILEPVLETLASGDDLSSAGEYLIRHLSRCGLISQLGGKYSLSPDPTDVVRADILHLEELSNMPADQITEWLNAWLKPVVNTMVDWRVRDPQSAADYRMVSDLASQYEHLLEFIEENFDTGREDGWTRENQTLLSGLKLKLHYALGHCYDDLGIHKPASEHLEQAVSLHRAATPNDPVALARTLTKLGGAYDELDDLERAEACLDEARRILADRDDCRYEQMTNETAYGNLLWQHGRLEESEQAFSTAADRYQSLYEEREYGELAEIANGLGNLYDEQERTDEALEQYQKALLIRQRDAASQDGNSEKVAEVLNNLGQLYHKKLQNYDEARKHLWDALIMRIRLHGQNHPEVAVLLQNLAAVDEDEAMLNPEDSPERREKLSSAFVNATHALRLFRLTRGERHIDTVGILNNLAHVHYSRGDFEQAIARYDDVLGTLSSMTPSPNHQNMKIHILVSKANCQTAANQLAEAEQALDDARRIMESCTRRGQTQSDRIQAAQEKLEKARASRVCEHR